MQTGYILMDFSVIFPMQLSEFIRSMNFGSNMKKKCIKKIAPKKLNFLDDEIIF